MPADYNTILIELNKTVKTLKFYPKGHPNLDESLDQCFAVIKDALDKEGQFVWRVDQNGFYIDEKPIAPAHSPAAAFAKQFFLRSVKQITFSPNLTNLDIQELMSLLMMEPKEIKAQGGAEKVMIREGATGIFLNDMNYDDALEMKEELEEEAPVEEVVEEEVEEAPEEEEILEEIEEIKTEDEHMSAEQVKGLNEIIAAIKTEDDLLKYQDLCTALVRSVREAITLKEFERAYEALKTMNNEIHTIMQKSKEIRDLAIDTLNDIINKDVLKYLVAKLANRNDKELTTVRQILAAKEYDGIEVLLDMLINDDNSHLRRAIYDTLVVYGEKIRPHIKTRLSDRRWFVVRQMASLLGELGGKESLDRLESLYDHEDVRVKKEVLKSLSRINSVKSKGILANALLDNDPGIKSQAMISLGMLKDIGAVEPIGEIITSKGITDTDELTVALKEGVKALGIIGDTKAIPYLEKIATKTVWFNKEEYNEVKALAVTSLGKIGTDEAINIVHKVHKGSSGKLADACKRVIESVKAHE